jgi:hypothetical protein
MRETEFSYSTILSEIGLKVVQVNAGAEIQGLDRSSLCDIRPCVTETFLHY